MDTNLPRQLHSWGQSHPTSQPWQLHSWGQLHPNSLPWQPCSWWGLHHTSLQQPPCNQGKLHHTSLQWQPCNRGKLHPTSLPRQLYSWWGIHHTSLQWQPCSWWELYPTSCLLPLFLTLWGSLNQKEPYSQWQNHCSGVPTSGHMLPHQSELPKLLAQLLQQGLVALLPQDRLAKQPGGSPQGRGGPLWRRGCSTRGTGRNHHPGCS